MLLFLFISNIIASSLSIKKLLSVVFVFIGSISPLSFVSNFRFLRSNFGFLFFTSDSSEIPLVNFPKLYCLPLCGSLYFESKATLVEVFPLRVIIGASLSSLIIFLVILREISYFCEWLITIID